MAASERLRFRTARLSRAFVSEHDVLPELGRERPPAPRPRADFCAICWAAGYVLEPVSGGLGHLPVVCPTCGGTGRAGA